MVSFPKKPRVSLPSAKAKGMRRAVGRWAAQLELRYPGFSLQPTRGFWLFLGAVAVLGMAALNTGNNALYLLLSLSLGAFVASGVLSRHTLAHLRGTVVFPPELTAQGAARLRIEAQNTSPWLPAWGVVCRLAGLPGVAVLPVVPPGGRAEGELLTIFPRRGRLAKPSLVIEVRLPLGFFVKSLSFPQEGEVVVYPRRVAAGLPRWAASSWTARRRGRLLRGGDVEALREFRPGDDVRDVHWKQTARQGRVIVMERREQEAPVQLLVLDNTLARPWDPVSLERFEDLVAEVAAVARKLLAAGAQVGLQVGEEVIPPAAGSQQLRRILEALAVVRPVARGSHKPGAGQGVRGVYRLAEEA